MGPESLRRGNGERLVAVLCAIPILAEAVKAAVDFARVETFADKGDIAGLLRWLRPDAVVIDSEAAAEVVTPVALELSIPVLCLSPQEGSLRLFRDGAWDDAAEGTDLDALTVRNVLAGALFARAAAVG